MEIREKIKYMKTCLAIEIAGNAQRADQNQSRQ
jgi:hypothetical protein